MIDINLVIATKASEFYLDDMTGRLTIEAATKKAQREVQKKLKKYLRSEDND